MADESTILSTSCLETLRLVTGAMGLAVLVLDAVGRITGADETAAAVFGAGDPAEIAGRDMASLLIDEFSLRQCREIRVDLRDAKPVAFELERGDRVWECRSVLLDKKPKQGAATLLVMKDITALRRADESLRRERQRHIFLMEALPGFLVLVGEDRSIHYSNRQFRKYFGKDFSCEEFFRKHGDTAEPPTFQDILGQEPRQWEWRAADGRFFQLFTHPMTSEEGALEVIIHGLDITVRKQAELVLKQSHDELEQRVQERTSELRESEARFRAVVEDQTELICRFSPDRTIYFVNEAFCRFFGEGHSDLVGQRFLPGIVQEDRWIVEGFFDPVTPAAPFDTTSVLEFRVRLEGREECWLRWNIRGIRDAEGRLLEYQAVGSDVTMLRHAEKRYFNLIQNLPIIIFALDYEFQLVFINETCGAVLGYSPEEALSTPDWFFERVHPDDRAMVREVMYSSVMQDQNKAPTVEFRFQHRKGYLVSLMARPIPAGRRPSTGAWDRVEGIIMDVTERTFLDKMLVQRERLNTLGAMSDELAHEIRNPLFALGGYARRLKGKHPELMEAGIILEEAVRLEKLLDRIRSYLEPVSVTRKPCRLEALISFSADILSASLAREVVTLEVEADQEISVVHSDPDVLSQVFMNLFTNGMAAISRGGTIHVSTYETPKHVAVTIRLSPMKKTLPSQEQMLMPFDMEDHGVNLAVSYRLLKNVDGYLDFSQDDEKAQFTVLLPKNGAPLPDDHAGKGAKDNSGQRQGASEA